MWDVIADILTKLADLLLLLYKISAKYTKRSAAILKKNMFLHRYTFLDDES